MELQGEIKVIGKTETFGTNGFRKRPVVIKTDEQYPQVIEVEFLQDKCDILDKYSVGQKVKIKINIRGREWTNPEGDVKYFNSIQGWKIESGSGSAANQQAPTGQGEGVEKENDLPF